MENFVLGLCGYAGVGKDALAKALTARGWTRISFADPLREMLLRLDPVIPLCETPVKTARMDSVVRLSWLIQQYGWEETKRRYREVRALLQRLGTDCVREIIDTDAWVNIAEKKIEVSGDCVITDVRFPNERRICDSIIRIERDGVKPVNFHVSETIEFPVDATFRNNGQLEDMQDAFVELVNKEVERVRNRSAAGNVPSGAN